MRVLVTGHTGYIGSLLVPMLLSRGHDVAGYDSDLFKACTFTGSLADVPHINKDIRDVSAEDVEGFDAVIHLAGLSNDPMGDYRPELTVDINETASLKLAELAKKAGTKRFLFASSCSNYGAAGDNFLTESADFNPVTPYGVSKVRVEAGLTDLASDSFSPTYIRASTAYGFSPRIRFDLVCNNLTAWAYTTGKVMLKSDGTPWRPIVHVEDICRAYIATLEADRDDIHDRGFNVGLTTENYQIREIAQIVKDVVPDCDLDFADGAGPDVRNYRVDCNLLATTLHGFKPQWTCRRGIEEMYQIYKKVGLTLDEFEGEKFKRIAHIQKLVEEGKLDESMRWKT